MLTSDIATWLPAARDRRLDELIRTYRQLEKAAKTNLTAKENGALRYTRAQSRMEDELRRYTHTLHFLVQLQSDQQIT